MPAQETRGSIAPETNYLEDVAAVTRRVFRLRAGSAYGLQAEMRDWAQRHLLAQRCGFGDIDCEELRQRLAFSYDSDWEFADSLASAFAGQPTSYWDRAHIRKYELTLVYLVGRMMASGLLQER